MEIATDHPGFPIYESKIDPEMNIGNTDNIAPEKKPSDSDM